jgi:hypothetical protein
MHAQYAALSTSHVRKPSGSTPRPSSLIEIQYMRQHGHKSGMELGRYDTVKYAGASRATGLMIRTADEIAPVLKMALIGRASHLHEMMNKQAPLTAPYIQRLLHQLDALHVY